MTVTIIEEPNTPNNLSFNGRLPDFSEVNIMKDKHYVFHNVIEIYPPGTKCEMLLIHRDGMQTIITRPVHPMIFLVKE